MKCINESVMNTYVENNFLHNERNNIESHFFHCEKCTRKVRNLLKLNQINKILKTKNTNKIYNKSIDTLNLAAASSQNVTSSHTKSHNGKYILKLFPFIDKNSILVEVQVLDKSVNGILVIENKNNIIFEAIISDGIACDEIKTSNFKNVFISVKDL